jgi:L-galactose dehydrogenase
MEFTTLGRTGLRVSIAGLGTGGPSRLGQKGGLAPDQTVALIRRAIDLGINFFDTAENYGTEAILGAGLRGVPRDLNQTLYFAGYVRRWNRRGAG